MPLVIEEAQKIKQYARICLWGVEKSGKTHTALTLATAFDPTGKIGVISAEHGSSALLAGEFPHTIINLTKRDVNGKAPVDPFSVKRYEEALNLFIENKYKVIIIDSLSHLWNGEGGLLEAVGKAGSKTFSTDSGWGVNSPLYSKFINQLLVAPCHIICTLRAKDKYEMVPYTKYGKDGKEFTSVMPKNVGEAPIIRKQFGFEMQLMVRMDEFTAQVQASAIEKYIPRGEIIERPTVEFGYRILEGLDGVTVPEPSANQKRVRVLLDAFFCISPRLYKTIPDWEVQALRTALELNASDVLPVDYSDDEVFLLEQYVEGKKLARDQPKPVVQTPSQSSQEGQQASLPAQPDTTPVPQRNNVPAELQAVPLAHVDAAKIRFVNAYRISSDADARWDGFKVHYLGSAIPDSSITRAHLGKLVDTIAIRENQPRMPERQKAS